MRWWVAHSAEATTQLQAAFMNHLGGAAEADEAAGFEWAMSLGDKAYGQFTASSAAGKLATVDARTLIAELGAYVILSTGPTPTLTRADGQVYTFRNATELAGFALGLAVQQGCAGPAAWDTYALTVSCLSEMGQGYIQAAYVLSQASQSIPVPAIPARWGDAPQIGAVDVRASMCPKNVLYFGRDSTGAQ